MPNHGDDIISELEAKFIDTLSIKNSVQTSDNHLVRLDKELWNTSPVLRQKCAEGLSFMSIAVSRSTVEALLELHRNGNSPKAYHELLNLLAATCELEIEDLTRKCVAAIFEKIKNSFEIDYPSQCSIDAVMYCFKFMLNSPLRTAKVYGEQMARVAKHCNNNPDVMINAMNLLKQKVERFTSIHLDGIPVKFNETILPVVVYNRTGKLQTAIVDGEELKPLDLFGKHFDIGALTLEGDFYLKYGEYILFKSGSRIFRKNLRGDDEPAEILQDCNEFLTRGKFVFALHTKHEHFLVSRWSADDTFERIYRTRKSIHLENFQSETRLLALKVVEEEISLLLFRLSENDTLCLLAQKKILPLETTILSKTEMLLVVQKPDKKGCLIQTFLETYQIAELDDTSVPNLEVPLDDKYWRIRVRQAGNKIFLHECGALRIAKTFPSLTGSKTICSEGENPILSELCMLL